MVRLIRNSFVLLSLAVYLSGTSLIVEYIETEWVRLQANLSIQPFLWSEMQVVLIKSVVLWLTVILVSWLLLSCKNFKTLEE